MKYVIHYKPIIFMVIIYCNKELTYVRINHLLNNVNFKLNKNANNHLVFDLYFDFPKYLIWLTNYFWRLPKLDGKINTFESWMIVTLRWMKRKFFVLRTKFLWFITWAQLPTSNVTQLLVIEIYTPNEIQLLSTSNNT